MKQAVKNIILNEKIIVIVRKAETSKIISLANALYDGGIRLIEVTFDQTKSFESDETEEQIRLLVEHFEERMCIGAGTVMSEKQVEAAYNAGAKYIISPNVNKKVIEKTLALGIVSIPGALTPTEIQNAYEYGADFVKLFPAGELGINYVKAVLAPLSHIPALAVGGIDQNNLSQFLNIGIKGVGIGSNIVKKNLIDQNDYAQITELAKKYTAVIRKG